MTFQVGERFASRGRNGNHEGARHPIKCDCAFLLQPTGQAVADK
jgi:hypothetical protein